MTFSEPRLPKPLTEESIYSWTKANFGEEGVEGFPHGHITAESPSVARINEEDNYGWLILGKKRDAMIIYEASSWDEKRRCRELVDCFPAVKKAAKKHTKAKLKKRASISQRKPKRAKLPLKEAIIGKWEGREKSVSGGYETVTYEFFKDGTVVGCSEEMGSLTGDYKFIGKGRIRLEFGGLGQLVGPIVIKASLTSKDELVVTWPPTLFSGGGLSPKGGGEPKIVRPGEGRGGKKIVRYRRIK
jgi:hypothetical protein